MSMSKRDYEAIAKVLNQFDYETARNVADELAQIFEKDNPRFNSNKFISVATLSHDTSNSGEGKYILCDKPWCFAKHWVKSDSYVKDNNNG